MPNPSEHEFEIENSSVEDTNVAQGDGNRTVQGQGNQAIIGDNNLLARTVVVQQPSTENRPSLERTLLNQVANEVSYRRQQSLHNQVFIELGKTHTPAQVNCPWAMEVKIGKQAPEPIPDGQTVAHVFKRKDMAGKLLILGQPGAGKTTTLLDLANALLENVQQDISQPIPVLFNLSSWRDDKQPIAQWLVKELREKYQVREAKGQELLEAKKLLPLLDGLDELAAHRQEGCVKAINTWLGSDLGVGQVAVCSRILEYETYATKLALNGAICLQPLETPEIERYLQQTDKPELWSVVSQDQTILELVQVPLWLSVLALARDELDLEKWARLETDQERLTLLLDAYVVSRLAAPLSEKNCKYYKPAKAPTARQTRRWLMWLAQNMDQDEFLIERMQPTLLITPSEKWQMRLLGALIWGLIWGLMGGLIGGLIGVLMVGWVGGVFWGMIGILIGEPNVGTLEILFWGLLLGLFGGLRWGLIAGLIGGLIAGLFLGLFWGLTEGLSSINTVEVLKINISRDARKIFFNKLIRSLRWGLNYGLIGVLIVCLFGVLFGVSGGLKGVIAGLYWGLLGGLRSACFGGR